jgi:hypothetical protein
VKTRIVTATACAVFTTLLYAACGDSTGPGSDPLVWTAVQSPAVGLVTGISGTSASDVWAVGVDGIMHFDGATWSKVETGVAAQDHARAVWPRTPSDVWMVNGPTILHYDGTTWTATTSPTSNSLTGIWGSSASDIWAVGPAPVPPRGSAGALIHYDGTTWSSVASGTAENLWGVWGTSPSDIWVGGENVILHYDGSQWSTLSISNFALGIWASSPSDVWAATSPGLLHYDGARWSTIPSGFLFDNAPGTGPAPYAVWGSSPSSVWVGGWHGVPAYTCCGKMQHYDGSRWSDVPLPAGTGIIYAIWGSSASDVWAGTAVGIIHGTPAKP